MASGSALGVIPRLFNYGWLAMYAQTRELFGKGLVSNGKG
jgi:hypothetical protein